MSERLWGILVSSLPQLVEYCIKVTIPLTACIYLLSLALALVLALLQVQRVPVLRQLARVYVWVFRGTPLIVQLYIIFFGLPSLGIVLNAFPAAVIAFSLNYAAYMSETVRAAILAVPEGQTEAGYMIGLSSGQVMRRIVLPQAARVAFPTLFGSLIGLTKDSSLAASITVVEMFKTAQQIAARTFEPFALYCEVALVYLALNTILTLLQSFLEKKLAWQHPVKTNKKELAVYAQNQ
ncbi:amino acid ABC transporter permease [Gemmiger sp.]